MYMLTTSGKLVMDARLHYKVMLKSEGIFYQLPIISKFFRVAKY